jgi:transposase
VAIAEGGREREVRFVGEIENSAAATAKLVRKLAAKYDRLTFCYEAGPAGYGLHRQIENIGHGCVIAAPSLIPKKPGDRVKTNRRDAVSLAKLLRANELTAVWVADQGFHGTDSRAGRATPKLGMHRRHSPPAKARTDYPRGRYRPTDFWS